MPNNTEADQILQDARERARLAMKGEEQVTEDKATQAKRLTARLAMEGLERQHTRETREKEVKDKEAMIQKIDDEVKKRKEETEIKKRKEETEKQKQQMVKDQEQQQKEDTFTNSQNVIEQLKKEKSSGLYPLHTLQSDLAETIQTEKLSKAKIAIIEQQPRPIKPNVLTTEKSSSPSNLAKKITFGFLILTLIIAGGSGGYWYWTNKIIPSTTPAKTIQAIIYAETSTEINTTKLPPSEFLSSFSKLINTQAVDGEIINNIYFTKEIPNDDGQTSTKTLLSFTEFLKYSQSSIPEDFSRFVNSYMVGLHKGPNQNSIFIALKIELFDNVFSTMLDHENDYIQNIFQSLDPQSLIGTTTKSTFTDRLVKNLNTRTLFDEQGKILMIYCFLDRETLIIAQNEDALYQTYVSYNIPRLK